MYKIFGLGVPDNGTVIWYIEKDKVKSKVRCCCFHEGNLQSHRYMWKDLNITTGPLRLIYIYNRFALPPFRKSVLRSVLTFVTKSRFEPVGWPPKLELQPRGLQLSVSCFSANILAGPHLVNVTNERLHIFRYTYTSTSTHVLCTRHVHLRAYTYAQCYRYTHLHLHIFRYTYTCTSTHVLCTRHVHVRAYTYVQCYRYTHLHLHIFRYTYTCTSTHLLCTPHVHVRAYTYVQCYRYTHLHLHIFRYTYTYTSTHVLCTPHVHVGAYTYVHLQHLLQIHPPTCAHKHTRKRLPTLPPTPLHAQQDTAYNAFTVRETAGANQGEMGNVAVAL